MLSAGSFDIADIQEALESELDVTCIHDLHVWNVGDMPCLTCHAVVSDIEKQPDVLLK